MGDILRYDVLEGHAGAIDDVVLALEERIANLTPASPRGAAIQAGLLLERPQMMLGGRSRRLLWHGVWCIILPTRRCAITGPAIFPKVGLENFLVRLGRKLERISQKTKLAEAIRYSCPAGTDALPRRCLDRDRFRRRRARHPSDRARAMADMILARPEASPQRFYSMSAQVRLERKDYYATLERTRKGDLGVILWLRWFSGCLVARGVLVRDAAGRRSTRYSRAPWAKLTHRG